MFGISLPIVATAVLLVGQTATDAPLPNPIEMREIVVTCGAGPNPQGGWTVQFNPVTNVAHVGIYSRGTYFPFNRSHAVRERQYISFETDAGMMQIDLQAMVYKMTKGHGPNRWPTVSVGVCKTVP